MTWTLLGVGAALAVLPRMTERLRRALRRDRSRPGVTAQSRRPDRSQPNRSQRQQQLGDVGAVVGEHRARDVRLRLEQQLIKRRAERRQVDQQQPIDPGVRADPRRLARRGVDVGVARVGIR